MPKRVSITLFDKSDPFAMGASACLLALVLVIYSAKIHGSDLKQVCVTSILTLESIKRDPDQTLWNFMKLTCGEELKVAHEAPVTIEITVTHGHQADQKAAPANPSVGDIRETISKGQEPSSVTSPSLLSDHGPDKGDDLPVLAVEVEVLQATFSDVRGSGLTPVGGRYDRAKPDLGRRSFDWPIEPQRVVQGSLGAFASGDGFKGGLRSKLDSELDAYAEGLASKWLSNSEISVRGVSNGKPTFGLLTVQPIYESADFADTFFSQISAFNNEDRQTLNVGLGYRRLSEDKFWLYGLNVFYDQEFPYDHQRGSVGIELRSSVIELNSNKYFGISKWKMGRGGLEERALGGYDVEIGLSIPYMPGSRIYHKSFRWEGEEGSDDLQGSATSLAISGNLIVPGLTLEVGSKDFRNRERRSFASLTYTYPTRRVREVPLFSPEMYKLTSMVDRRLERVRRENLIVKQVRGRGTISFR